MKARKLYKRCLLIHAVRWISEDEPAPVLEYLELNGGPLLAYYIRKKGPKKVLKNFIDSIEKIK
jgi:hypothetical protein